MKIDLIISKLEENCFCIEKAWDEDAQDADYDGFLKDLKMVQASEGIDNVRVLRIDVPYSAIRNLFDPPTPVTAQVIGDATDEAIAVQNDNK